MLLRPLEVKMYISRVEIDVNNRAKIKDLSHVGAIHNWVERAFPKEILQHNRTRKLWRIDNLGGKEYLLIVSPAAPDISVLEIYGVKGSGSTKEYSKFLDGIGVGLRAKFRVTLNPVIAVSEGEGKRGKIKPHVTVEHQKKFLLDRAEKNGFHLAENEFDIVERTYVTLKKEGERPLGLSKVTYEGVLTVTDPDRFKLTLTEGFGKKKAYGFGLMTIIPF